MPFVFEERGGCKGIRQLFDSDRGLLCCRSYAGRDTPDEIFFYTLDGRRAAGRFWVGPWPEELRARQESTGIWQKFFGRKAEREEPSICIQKVIPCSDPELVVEWMGQSWADEAEQQYFENLSPTDGCQIIGFSRQESLKILNEALQTHWLHISASKGGKVKLQLEFSKDIIEWAQN